MRRLQQSALSPRYHHTYDPLGEAVNSKLGVSVDEYMVIGRCSANGLIYGLRCVMNTSSVHMLGRFIAQDQLTVNSAS